MPGRIFDSYGMWYVKLLILLSNNTNTSSWFIPALLMFKVPIILCVMSTGRAGCCRENRNTTVDTIQFLPPRILDVNDRLILDIRFNCSNIIILNGLRDFFSDTRRSFSTSKCINHERPLIES